MVIDAHAQQQQQQQEMHHAGVLNNAIILPIIMYVKLWLDCGITCLAGVLRKVDGGLNFIESFQVSDHPRGG